MKKPIQRPCTRTLTTRLPDHQFQHIKLQPKPSDYIRALIENDLSQVVNHAKA